MFKTLAASLLISATVAVSAHAATVHPTSYVIQNGDSNGSVSFWDDSYTGRGDNTVDGARLRRGLGDLTDGIIATQNWDEVEGTGGPYVGWSSRANNLRFNFDQAYDFTSATFHFDGSGGGDGVGGPRRIRINGIWENVPAAGADPFAFTFDFMRMPATDTLFVRIVRGREFDWTLLSEVTFDANLAPVPLPASGLMLLAGLGGIAALRRRGKKRD
jgi:hypothetical protein